MDNDWKTLVELSTPILFEKGVQSLIAYLNELTGGQFSRPARPNVLHLVFSFLKSYSKVIAVTSGLGVCYGIWRLLRQRITSWLIAKTKIDLNKTFRQVFLNEMNVVTTGKREGHSHPAAASFRTGADRSIDDFILRQGMKVYSVSTGLGDRHGQRWYYDSKDLSLDYRNDPIEPRHIFKMVDVDYYADMKSWLWYGKPILLYTFVPTSAGGPVTDGIFNIVDDVVKVSYNGGGYYEHKLWDYSMDHFVVRGAFWSLMVKVDQMELPEESNYRIIALTPMTWVPTIFLSGMTTRFELRRKKLTFADGKLNIVSCYPKDGKKNTPDSSRLEYSISLPGAGYSVKLPASSFDGVLMRNKTREREGNRVIPAEIERRIGNYMDKREAPLAADILCYLNGSEVRQLKMTTPCGKVPARHYQATGPLLLEEGKETGVSFMPPILDNKGFFPMRSYNNEVSTVYHRITSLANTKPVKGKYHKYLAEFLEALDVGVCRPYDLDEVLAKQRKPRQLARNKQVEWAFNSVNWIVKAFQKGEAYQELKPARNISSVDIVHNLKFSQYTYALKDYFMKFEWWMPGRTPVEIADALCKLTLDTDFLTEADFSGYDATLSQVLRVFARSVMLRLFPVEYHAEIRTQFEAEFNIGGVTRNGVSYGVGYSRISGSPVTTWENTLIHAGVLYCAYRSLGLIMAGEIGKMEALLYSDDGAYKGNIKIMFEKVCTDLGLVAKVNVVDGRSADPEFNFLGRVFTDPWYTTDSMQDPVRTLGKLHMSVRRNYPAEVLAYNKALGYFPSDNLTPVLGAWIDYTLRNVDTVHKTRAQLVADELAEDRPYMTRCYPNDSWPQFPQFTDGKIMIMVKRLNVDTDTIDRMHKELAKQGCTDPIVFDLPENAKSETIIGDTVIPAADPLKDTSNIPIAAESPSTRASSPAGSKNGKSRRKP